MKTLITVALLLLGTDAMAMAQGSVEQTVMDLERQWAEASLANETAIIEQLLALDHVSIGSDASVYTRAFVLANVSKMKWERIDIIEMKVQVHGDSAVVIASYSAKGVGFEGIPFDEKWRSLDTWVKMPDGKWRCVAAVSVSMK